MKYLYISILIIFILPFVSADTIQTTSGELLEGTIIQDNQDGVILQTKYGQIKLLKNQILKMVCESQVPGDKYYEEKEYDKAIVEYQKAIDQNPQNKETVPKLLYQIGLCQIELKNCSQAIETLQKVSVGYPDNSIKDKTLFQLAQCYEKQGDSTLAMEKYQQLVKEFPDSPYSSNALYEIGLLYEEANNPDSALEAYQRLANEYPKSDKLSLAKEHIDQIQFDKSAPELLSQAKARFNEINRMKWDYKNLVLYDEIIKDCQKIIIKARNSKLVLQAQKLIIACYTRQAEYGKREGAVEKYKILIQKNSESDQGLKLSIELANDFYVRKEFKESERLYDDIIQKYPNNKYTDLILYFKARSSYNLEKYKDAISACKMLIFDHPKSDWAENVYFMLGCCYYIIGENLAIDYFKQLMIKYPDGVLANGALYYIGEIYYQNKLYEEAEEVLEKFILLAKNNNTISKELSSNASRLLLEIKGKVGKDSTVN